MALSEKDVAACYKRVGDVSLEECFIGGHNCGTCMHSKDHNMNWEYFDHSYCTMAPLPGYDKKANMLY